VAVLRQLDLVLLAAVLPIFLVAGLPLAGYGAAAAAWLAQRAIKSLLARRAAASSEPRTVVGLVAASMIARAWLVALTIFAVGVSDKHAGLAAALLVIVLFTIHFNVGLIARAFPDERKARSS
jgi:hypothetical protein